MGGRAISPPPSGDLLRPSEALPLPWDPPRPGPLRVGGACGPQLLRGREGACSLPEVGGARERHQVTSPLPYTRPYSGLFFIGGCDQEEGGIESTSPELLRPSEALPPPWDPPGPGAHLSTHSTANFHLLYCGLGSEGALSRSLSLSLSGAFPEILCPKLCTRNYVPETLHSQHCTLNPVPEILYPKHFTPKPVP